VDDTLLLGGALRTIASIFKIILDQFTQVSGGMINKNKSHLYAWNVNSHSIMVIANIFQFSF
jgi:hypothetical protein